MAGNVAKTATIAVLLTVSAAIVPNVKHTSDHIPVLRLLIWYDMIWLSNVKFYYVKWYRPWKFCPILLWKIRF